MMDRLYFLRIDGSSFFGHEMTYLSLAQDIVYVMSFMVLMSRAQGTSQGISMKTQFLYTLAFSARLTEYFPTNFINYELVSTLVFLAMSVFLLSFVLGIQGVSLETENDSFWLNPLMYCTNIFALLFNYNHLNLTIPIVFWAWSHYLTAVAMLPQLWMIAKSKVKPDASILIYVNAQGVCRILNILHWIYLFYDVDSVDFLAVMSDCFHIAAHCVFLLYLSFWRDRENAATYRHQKRTQETIVVLNEK